MSDFAIETTHLRKEFGRKTAVADLTLQVKRGEVFGFLGANGAGKTTSVKMLLGLTKPTAGSAKLLGRPLADRSTRAKIGFLPEHFRFHEWLTATEFLRFHGRLYGMNKDDIEAAIPDLLELVGLRQQAETQLKTFSKGMLQRVGLAQALINDPDLVFLDEPTSGLDPMGLRLVRDIINGLREEGTTVFLNSHLLSEVEKTCNRVTFIRQGTILETLDLAEHQETAVRVTLRVGQPTEQLLHDLTNFGDEIGLDKANGRVHLCLAAEEQVPQLANWLIQNDYTLYELTPEHLSLEDRFLQIVGNESDEVMYR